MKKLHNLKIGYDFGQSILDGHKTFEIRIDDRNYQPYDCIVFDCPASEKLTGLLSKKIYQIGYLTHFNQKEGWVVFGIKELK